MEYISLEKAKKVLLIGIDGLGYAEYMKSLCLIPPHDIQWIYPGYQRSLLIDLSTWLACTANEQAEISLKFPN